MPGHEHVPLDQSTRQIRLLRFVDSDADTAPIRCRLDAYNLDHCPPFVALSYTWGDVYPTRDMILNGEVFPLRQNLHSALSVLREDTLKQGSCSDDLFWIDAICINQQDDTERSHQVNMMGTIYSEARFVLVWLGPGGVDSDRALNRIAAYAIPPWVTRLHEGDLGHVKGYNRYTAQSGIESSAYWERMWVIQEFTLAKDIILLKGRSKLSWHELVKWTIGEFVLSPMGYLVHGRTRREQGNAYAIPETLDLLIRVFEKSRCSDVRDKVYALLSLVQARSGDSKSLYPDYTVSPRELYYRVLSNLRQSPSLMNTADWNNFRAQLCRILVIRRDEDFERNDFLYRASEHERPDQKTLLCLHPDHRTGLESALLKDVADYLHWPLARMERDPQRVYEEVIQSVQTFPKDEDPEARNCFDKLLKEALGLWSTTGEDSETWNMFIDFPE